MQFFFPQTAALINWERPHEFLDKEFQQIDREAEQGRRYVYKLVKVWQIQGQEIWLLIHVEIQARSEDTFAERMFSYNLRIFDNFVKPAISLAILCDTDTTWRPNQYSYNYPDTKLNFEFGTVKLLSLFTLIWKTSLPFLSPARREALNSPPSLLGKGAGGLGFALVFPHDVKSQ